MGNLSAFWCLKEQDISKFLAAFHLTKDSEEKWNDTLIIIFFFNFGITEITSSYFLEEASKFHLGDLRNLATHGDRNPTVCMVIARLNAQHTAWQSIQPASLGQVKTGLCRSEGKLPETCSGHMCWSYLCDCRSVTTFFVVNLGGRQGYLSLLGYRETVAQREITQRNTVRKQ